MIVSVPYETSQLQAAVLKCLRIAIAPTLAMLHTDMTDSSLQPDLAFPGGCLHLASRISHLARIKKENQNVNYN